jgi:hypothetical protein
MIYNKHIFWERFKLVISDPLNKLIIKLPNSGKLDGEIITMYNGVKVYQNSYCGCFSDILLINEGVYEPSEEYLFQKVLSEIKGNKPTMLELGSYWGFYSMSFLKQFKQGTSYCIEAGIDEISSGINNFHLNQLESDFTQGFIGNNNIKVDDFLASKKIEKLTILHSDIQGYEMEMLEGARNTLENKLVDYIFVSTHTNDLHYQCIGNLLNFNYKIIAEVDLTETFCEDGIILAVSPNVEMQNIQLPRRSKEYIYNDAHLQLLYDKL